MAIGATPPRCGSSCKEACPQQCTSRESCSLRTSNALIETQPKLPTRPTSGLGLGCAKTSRNGPKPLQPGLLRVETTGTSSPDRRQKRLHADDVHHAGEIVGKHVQRHLGGALRQPLHQEVRRAHPHLERAEGVLDRLAALAHRLRVLVKPPLHGFEHVLVFPPRDAALLSGRATTLDRAAAACAGRIAMQLLPMFLGSEGILEFLTGRAAIDILLRQIDEVLLAKATFRLGA